MPMPLVEPVTMATFPVRSKAGMFFSFAHPAQLAIRTGGWRGHEAGRHVRSRPGGTRADKGPYACASAHCGQWLHVPPSAMRVWPVT